MQSEWFFYGSAMPKPSLHAYNQFALYSPVIDRFVMVFDDAELLRRISVCWSSRCQLILCELGGADNFEPDLIDNTCCLNWSMSDTQHLPWTRWPNFDRAPYQVQQLVYHSCGIDPSDLLIQNLPYLWASITWLWIEKNQLVPEHHIVPKHMMPCLDLPCGLPTNADLAQDLARIIHSEMDFDVARDRVKQLFADYEHSDFTKVNLRINGA